MGKSTILARLVAVCAVTAVAGGVLAGVPVSAQAPAAPSSSVATPGTSVASPAAVGGDGVTPRAARATGLRLKIVGVTAGGRASVKVTGPKQSKRKKAKKYSKVILLSTTLRVHPGVYRVTSANVPATGGTDVPTVATKTLRVRKNKLTGFTVRYRFVAYPPVPPVPPVVSCASFAVGETGPGGGKIFYVDKSRPVGSQCFEAAPDGWADGVDPTAVWGCEGTLILGPVGLGIGTGGGNTTTIVTECTAAGIAAKLAVDYPGGPGDWFLPSKDELNQLCKYARNQSPTAGNQSVPCNGVTGPLQPGFVDEAYWSSRRRAMRAARCPSTSTMAPRATPARATPSAFVQSGLFSTLGSRGRCNT